MKRSLLVGLLILFGSLGFAQKNISGVVIEETKAGKFRPIPFANVYWLGTQSGTSTDTTGYFELPMNPDTRRLIFSYVGYSSDTVKVEQPDKLTIILKHEQVLDAVEVVYREKSTEISYMDALKTEQIGQDELYKAACCNLSESFETNPSVDVAITDAVTGTKQIQMLGLDGKYTQITREAIPDIRGLASVQGLTYIPGTWIESIQLNKGSGSVASGFESVTGQINVELEKPEKMNRWFLNGYGNQGGRTELNLNASQKLSDKVSTGVLLHGNIRPIEVNGNGDEFLDFPTGHMVNAVNRWKFTNNKGWEGQLGMRAIDEEKRGGQIDQEIGFPYELGWNTRRYEVWGKSGFVFPNAKYKSAGIQTKLVHHDYDGFFGNRQYKAQQQSGYVNTLYQSIFGTSTHKFRTGASFQYDKFTESLDSNQYNREEVVPGAFFEYTFTYFTKFSAVAGIRTDYHNYYGAFVTPRLHMRYEIKEGSVVRASAGRGQRTANVIAENISLLATSRAWEIDGDPSIPGFGLRQEIAWNFGLNFVQNLRIDYRPATLSIDFYHTEFENQTVVDMEDPRKVRIYDLVGRSYSTSAQAQFDYELVRNLDVRVAYRWYDVMTDYSGTLLSKPYISRHRAFVNLSYETKNDWTFDYTVQWQGPKRIPNTESNPVEYQLDKQSPDLILMNAQVSKSWKDRFSVYAGMENITNVKQPNPIVASNDPFGGYFDSSFIWGPIFGRMTYVGFRLKSKQ
ncbi:MAG: TonB-dependent receptor [Flavobacteriales bacterium]|nr:TonB-dependent receptor [Flavobacteriales bacterium]